MIIFDADMKAHPNFLNHVMPYLEEDPMTALVQTPQHFFNVDHTGDVFNHQNSTFFFGVQTGLDAWRATVCCGTNFAVRAAPLAAVGWFPTESITEDFLLSLKLTASGWHCRYHGHVLTTGEAPDDLMKFLKQGLGKHIKANAYRYRRTLDGELASIRRIYELKDRAFQALWAVFAAGMIGLFGFISRMLWGFYGDDIIASVMG